MAYRSAWSRFWLAAIGLLVIALDQWTKAWVRNNLPLNISSNPVPWLDPIFTFTHTQNTGAAFGLFKNLGGVFVLVALAVILAIAIYYQQLASNSWLLRVAFGLQLGGAAGNLIDRLRFGYVTDFVDVRWWPIFNVADSSVVVGAILLAYYALFLDRPVGEVRTDQSPDAHASGSEAQPGAEETA